MKNCSGDISEIQFGNGNLKQANTNSLSPQNSAGKVEFRDTVRARLLAKLLHLSPHRLQSPSRRWSEDCSVSWTSCTRNPVDTIPKPTKQQNLVRKRRILQVNLLTRKAMSHLWFPLLAKCRNENIVFPCVSWALESSFVSSLAYSRANEKLK